MNEIEKLIERLSERLLSKHEKGLKKKALEAMADSLSDTDTDRIVERAKEEFLRAQKESPEMTLGEFLEKILLKEILPPVEAASRGFAEDIIERNIDDISLQTERALRASELSQEEMIHNLPELIKQPEGMEDIKEFNRALEKVGKTFTAFPKSDDPDNPVTFVEIELLLEEIFPPTKGILDIYRKTVLSLVREKIKKLEINSKQGLENFLVLLLSEFI